MTLMSVSECAHVGASACFLCVVVCVSVLRANELMQTAVDPVFGVKKYALYFHQSVVCTTPAGPNISGIVCKLCMNSLRLVQGAFHSIINESY